MSIRKTYCNICNLWLNSHDQLQAHQSGKSHRKRDPGTGPVITELTRSFVNQENCSDVALQSKIQNIDESCKMKLANISGQNDSSRSTTTKGDEYFCNICVVKLTSKSQADMHYDGAKHKKSLAVMAGKLEEVQYEGMPRKVDDVCNICNVPLSSKAVADAHYAGSKHEKRLKLVHTIRGGLGSVYSSNNIQPTSSSTPLSVITSAPTQIVPTSSVLMVSVPSGSVGQQHRGLAGGYLYCSFCGVSVNSQHQMEAHWQGMKHKNLVNGLLSQPKSTYTPRPTSNYGRYFNSGHIFSQGNYAPSNGQAVYRSRQSMPYVTHQY